MSTEEEEGNNGSIVLRTGIGLQQRRALDEEPIQIYPEGDSEIEVQVIK